jgi:hypothetical protein
MNAVLIQFIVLFLAQVAFASTPQDDADTIHIRSQVQDLLIDDAAAGAESKDIASLGKRLLAFSGKELQMPKPMRDPLLKKRAFHLCRSHGYARSEDTIKSQMISAVPFEKDFKVVQWVEGNLQTVSAAKTSHWKTISENGKGRHEVSGPFAVFSSLTCVR